MKDTNLAFHGFTTDAAKKSSIINSILNSLIASVEREIEIVTSTPKSGGRMEVSFSKHYNFHVTVDYDSGYMSHHQESNSDSSLENISETAHNPPSRPIYLSEDALLEKPEVNIKSKHVDTRHNSDENVRKFGTDFGREDLSESRNIFPSPETVLSTSVVSQRTTFSGFDDSDSDISVEIPCSKQIIVENVDNHLEGNDDRHRNNVEYSVNINDSYISQENAQFDSLMQSEVPQNPCTSLNDYKDNASVSSNSVKQYEEYENCSALNDITNTGTVKNDKNKKLTLIFSKNNKENIYSVKRKYQSMSPEKNLIPEKDDLSPDKSLTMETNLKSEHVVENETKENDLNSGDNPDQIIDSNKGFNLEKSHTPLIVENMIKETSDFDNSETPKNDLILRKELDLDEIVLQQENIGYCPVFPSEEEKVVFDIPKANESGQIECVQSNPPSVATPRKKYENPIDPNISPDLFENDEISHEVIKEPQPVSYIAEEKYILKKDQKLLKRAQNSLKGVFPPQSVTMVQLSVDEMLNRLEANKEYFWTNDKVEKSNTDKNNDKLNVSNESNCEGESKSLLITGNKDCVNSAFPQILQERYHGLHHNRSKLSEEFEDLCSKYGQRYVGAETQSTCTVFETNCVSPTKRKQTKQRWAVKSPGRRLSHLARRRITFSSANLQGGSSSSVMGSRARQILVDAKKLDLLNRRRSPRKSPRKNLRRTPRKTPSKSPRLKSRTPSSSAKKKLAMRFRELAGEIEKTVPAASAEKAVFFSKRALFQGPDHDKPSLFQPSTSGLSTFENELKKPGTKRALFISPSKSSPLKNSPFKRSPFKRRLELGAEKKRKRVDCDDAPPSKLARSVSVDIRPSESEAPTRFNRTRSEMNISLNRSQAGPSGELSAVHKKKLQWAVYEALRSQDITPSHAQFKVFASVLARVTRRFLPNLTGGGPKECGTTERMLRIARFHVYAVMKGKQVDEIVSEHLRNRMRNAKPQGYVGPGGFNSEKGNSETSNKENNTQVRFNTQESVDKKRLEQLSKPKAGTENRIDRIRKVINFGDDNR